MSDGLAHALGSSEAQNTKHFYAGATPSIPRVKCKKCKQVHKQGGKCKKKP